VPSDIVATLLIEAGKITKPKSLIGIEFVTIPAGKFWMGCSPSYDSCSGTNNPWREIEISKSFQIGKYEVTQQQWRKVMGLDPSHLTGEGSLPVNWVNWSDAQAFIAKLNAQNDGYNYRLPTEAEWEYAAHGGTAGPLYGNVDAIAWHRGNVVGHWPCPVGQKQSNDFGIYDMVGNVWEWCSGWWEDYSVSLQNGSKELTSERIRVLRGGAFNSDRTDVNILCRRPDDGHFGSITIGFRVCREKL
jgi:formylglycine-generating enzyme required for sulfatase activity